MQQRNIGLSRTVSTTTAKGIVAATIALFASFCGGMALSRLLYEALFPAAMWLGRPLPALLFALALGGLGVWGWRVLATKTGRVAAVMPFLPLLLNLAYLVEPVVNPTAGRFLFGAALWLALLLLYRAVAGHSRPAVYGAFLVGGLLAVYLMTLGQGVGRADTFEFQVVTPRLGIVHPTGYPLYLLLGRLFTLLPAGSVAWRLNLATAIYGMAAALVLFLLGRRLTGRALPALLAALVFALTPTFWSQAVEAEVYTLHALIVAVALYLMALLTGPVVEGETSKWEGRLPFLLAFALGLGLTNHLTTVILLPGAALVLFHAVVWRRRRLPSWRYGVGLLLAFLLPLLLYAYLPWRWAVVNGEPMGWGRFVEWVVGGRFQGALRLTAWLNDPARYEVVGRLLLAEWQPAGLLLLAPVGLLYLFWQRRLLALVLLLTWAGFIFYALNYYVPDLAVFLLPAHLILALWWGIGIVAVGRWLASRSGAEAEWVAIVALVAASPLLLSAATTWAQVDRSSPDGRTRWGQAVLELPLAEGAAILADSEKFPPLYYLQQAEGVRPDLEIMVLPDEAAYRSELSTRVAAGQTVYLARFVPGLAGEYHLRSVGPLVEVSQEALASPPPGIESSDLVFGSVRLEGYETTPVAATDPTATVLTLYWQTEQALDTPLHVFTRWHTAAFTSTPMPPAGQHPANNSYPTVAWEPGEVVVDTHLLPHPLLSQAEPLEIQVALAPPFTPADAMEWQTVTRLQVPQTAEAAQPLRALIGSVYLDATGFAEQVRPGTALPVVLEGCGPADSLAVSLESGEVEPAVAASGLAEECLPAEQFTRVFWVDTSVPAGDYRLLARQEGRPARCGWLGALQEGCVIGQVSVSGVPLPEGATNFADRIALLEVEVPEATLAPGGQLALTLEWQALAPMEEDYTVFVQVVDAQDRIVGQVDSWPLQGTLATSQWQPGETIRDPYVVQLAEDLAPGSYRLLLGWYLLETGQRLPVLDESGAVIEDRVIIPGLTVAQ